MPAAGLTWLAGAALLQLGLGGTLAVLAATSGLLLVPALIDRQRRLLHDLWTGTRIVRVPSREAGIRESPDRDLATRR